MKLVCWHCGGSLKDLPRPIRSQMRCPQCRVGLHVCRMCRFYDTRYIGHCSHNEADRVMDKEAANYCTLYSPNPDAFVVTNSDPTERAKSELDALFGSNETDDGSGDETPEPLASPQAHALREAESLFNLGDKGKGKG